MSLLQTIWLKLTWLDKAVIVGNLILLTVFFVSWRRKQRAVAAAKKLGERSEE